MRQINKAELKYLLDKGFKIGQYIHLSHSNKHKYYATESPKVLEALDALYSKPKE